MVKLINVADLAGMEFPAGRRTRVLVGEKAPLEAANFVLGHVTIYPGGSVPLHKHEQEEAYYIVSGEGSIAVGAETSHVRSGDCIYISPHSEHVLKNTSDQNMIMMFCYAPKTVAEHWAEELQGEDKT